MSAATQATHRTEYAAPDALPEHARPAVHALILVLADSKRLMGMRYADWTLGAPELEAGIACASMAQDEWGHARQLYALLRDFGGDTDRLEHGREPDEYRSIVALDAPATTWHELVALNALVDSALTEQFEALRESTYVPLRQRAEKLLDEERFHLAHGSAWFRRVSEAGDPARAALADAARSVLPPVLQWFGPDDGTGAELARIGVSARSAHALRTAYAERVGRLLTLVGAEDALTDAEPDFSAYDETRRRPSGGGPDARTIERVRGDRNRAFLMD